MWSSRSGWIVVCLLPIPSLLCTIFLAYVPYDVCTVQHSSSPGKILRMQLPRNLALACWTFPFLVDISSSSLSLFSELPMMSQSNIFILFLVHSISQQMLKVVLGRDNALLCYMSLFQSAHPRHTSPAESPFQWFTCPCPVIITFWNTSIPSPAFLGTVPWICQPQCLVALNNQQWFFWI